jgi:hypothetical protein
MLPNVMRVHGPTNMGSILSSNMCDPIDPNRPYQTYPGVQTTPGQQPQAVPGTPNLAPPVDQRSMIQRMFGNAPTAEVTLAPARPGNPQETIRGDNYWVQYQPANGMTNRNTPPMPAQAGPFTPPPYQSAAPFTQANQQAAPFAQPYPSSAPFAQPNQQSAPFAQPYAPPAGSQSIFSPPR